MILSSPSPAASGDGYSERRFEDLVITAKVSAVAASVAGVGFYALFGVNPLVTGTLAAVMYGGVAYTVCRLL